MQKILIFVALIISFGIGFMVGEIVLIKTQNTSIVKRVIDRSLDKYTIENLSKANIKPAKIIEDMANNKFTMEFEPGLDGKIKKVSGRVTYPVNSKKDSPVIIMIRGFVPLEIYKSGVGTSHAADYFTKNGYITFAPDFLGYGESDPEPINSFEARFQTYTTVISLIEGIKETYGNSNIAIWAHSNGGQIALTSLEITGSTYPTILWAPVSAAFPYSILYYSDEGDDKGKALRQGLSQFEEVYNSDLYSLSNYLGRIKAPIELNQGTADDAVPVSWSSNLVKSLKSEELEINYNIYPGVDHNMEPLWNNIIQKDLEFLTKNLK